MIQMGICTPGSILTQFDSLNALLFRGRKMKRREKSILRINSHNYYEVNSKLMVKLLPTGKFTLNDPQICMWISMK